MNDLTKVPFGAVLFDQAQATTHYIKTDLGWCFVSYRGAPVEYFMGRVSSEQREQDYLDEQWRKQVGEKSYADVAEGTTKKEWNNP